MKLSFDLVLGLGLGFLLSCFFYVSFVVLINLSRAKSLREMRKANREQDERKETAFQSKAERKKATALKSYESNVRDMKEFSVATHSLKKTADEAKVLTFPKK